MSYGKVKETFWTDKKVQAMSDDAKMLALYLLTGPHRNMLGCMRVPDGYITEDLKWSSERLTDAIDKLCGCQFIIRDDDGWTLITNQLRHDPLSKTPNHIKAAASIADTVPPEVSFYQEFASRFVAALEAIGAASEWHPHDIAIPLPSPLPQPSPEPTPPAALLDEGFPDFWEAYPKKVDRGHALKAYIAARKRGVSLETLLAGAERYRDDANRDPKFTKNAQGWLTGECWNDKPAEPPPGPEPASPEQKEANRLSTLAWAIEKGMVNIANNYPAADVRKLIASRRVTQEQVLKMGLLPREDCERAGCAA
jgi:hypothetical protein